MICPFCNTENDDNATVCINCGESLNTNDEAAITPDDKNSELKEIQERRLRKNRQRKRKKILLICLTTAIVIAGACFGAYQIQSYIDRTSTDKIVTVTSTPTATPEATETPVPTETPLPTETATPLPSETPAPTATPAAGWQTVAPQQEENDAPVATKKPAPAKTKAPAAKTAKPAAMTEPPAEPEVSVSTAKPVVSSPGFESSIAASNDVPQGQPIKSQLITISECVKAPVTGREIISFNIGNSKYFAYKPNEFSNTVNSSYTITAFSTRDVFYGLPVYEIVDFQTIHTEEYILPQSSQKVLSQNDIKGLSKNQLNLARNEIFARHGRTFKKQELQKYFESKSWYRVNSNYDYTNDYNNLSKTELKNALFLLEQENK